VVFDAQSSDITARFLDGTLADEALSITLPALSTYHTVVARAELP
jgi:hypothetical protein